MLEESKYSAPSQRPLVLLGLTLAVSLAPALWILLVPIPGPGPRQLPRTPIWDLTPGLLAWSTAGVCLFGSVLAWSLRTAPLGRLLRGVAGGLLVAAAAQMVLALMIFTGDDAAQPPDAASQVWLLARLSCTLAPLAAGWIVVRHRPPTLLGSTVTALVLSGIGSGTLLWAMLGTVTFEPVPRPWEFVPLLAIFATLFWVTRPLLRKGAQPSLIALELSLIPLAVAQVHAALAPFPDFGQQVAGCLALLASLILLVGLVLESRQTRGVDLELEALRQNLQRHRSDLDTSQRRLSGEIQVRKEMEVGLRMLRKAVETTQLGITLTDQAGEIIYANPAQAKMYGCEPGELIGQPANVFGPEGRRRPLKPADLGNLSGKQREGINVRRDGAKFPVRLSSDAVRDTRGQAVGVVTICEDITERKRVERELERRGAALEAVSFAAEWFLRSQDWQESLDQLLAELGRALDVSRIFVLESRNDGDDLMALRVVQSWSETADNRMPRGEAQPIQGPELDDLRRHLRTGKTWSGNTDQLPPWLTRSFVGEQSAELLLCPVFADDGPWGVIGLSEERGDRQWTVSEMESLSTAARILGAALVRQRHEEALRQSEERFRDLFENASDLIQSVDLEGRFQYVNRAWLRALGYTMAEVEQLNFRDVVAPDHLPHCIEIFQRVLQGETIDNLETALLTKRGEQILVEGSTSCYYRDGVAVATRGIFHNVTERREVDRLKSDFIAMVSHELRTPLTSIFASLQLLAGGTLGELPPPVRQLVEIADKNSRRLVRLVEDIIDVERIESGHIPFRWQVVDLLPIVEQALEANQAYAQQFGVTLRLDPRSVSAPVRVDTDRLMQVLTNLLSNAVKFSPQGGSVDIQLFDQGTTARVEIRDHGPGIPEEFRDKIFQRFVQVDSVHTRSKEGSGLGLSIARSIVQRLDGQIDFESQAGQGTVFYFEIPCRQEAPTLNPVEGWRERQRRHHGDSTHRSPADS